MDATNPKHVEIMRKAQLQYDRMRQDFVKHSMATRQGRAYFCDLLEKSHIFATSMTTEGSTNKIIFNEGERNIGLMILGDIMKFCPNEYVTMMREKNERDTINDNRLRGSDEDTRGSDRVTLTDNYVNYDDLPDDAKVEREYEPEPEPAE